MSAETMKMPEPIMLPITSVVALVSPRPLTNCCSEDAPLSMAFVELLKVASSRERVWTLLRTGTPEGLFPGPEKVVFGGACLHVD